MDWNGDVFVADSCNDRVSMFSNQVFLNKCIMVIGRYLLLKM